MSFRRDATESAQIGAHVWIIGGMVALLLMAISLAWGGANLLALPFVRQQETAINRASQGYVDAQQTRLIALTRDASLLAGEIEDARAQGRDTRAASAGFRATVTEIERVSATIDREYVPAATREFLSAYGRPF